MACLQCLGAHLRRLGQLRCIADEHNQVRVFRHQIRQRLLSTEREIGFEQNQPGHRFVQLNSITSHLPGAWQMVDRGAVRTKQRFDQC